MSASDENNHTAAEFFDKHIRFERALDDGCLAAYGWRRAAATSAPLLGGVAQGDARRPSHGEPAARASQPPIAKTLSEGFFAVGRTHLVKGTGNGVKLCGNSSGCLRSSEKKGLS